MSVTILGIAASSIAAAAQAWRIEGGRHGRRIFWLGLLTWPLAAILLLQAGGDVLEAVAPVGQAGMHGVFAALTAAAVAASLGVLWLAQFRAGRPAVAVTLAAFVGGGLLHATPAGPALHTAWLVTWTGALLALPGTAGAVWRGWRADRTPLQRASVGTVAVGFLLVVGSAAVALPGALFFGVPMDSTHTVEITIDAEGPFQVRLEPSWDPTGPWQHIDSGRHLTVTGDATWNEEFEVMEFTGTGKASFSFTYRFYGPITMQEVQMAEPPQATWTTGNGTVSFRFAVAGPYCWHELTWSGHEDLQAVDPEDGVCT